MRKLIVQFVDKEIQTLLTTHLVISDVDYSVSRLYYALNSLETIVCLQGKSIAEGDYEAYASDSTCFLSDQDKNVENSLDSGKKAVRVFLYNCVQQNIITAKSSASNAQQSETSSHLPVAFKVQRVQASVSRIDQLLNTRFVCREERRVIAV